MGQVMKELSCGSWQAGKEQYIQGPDPGNVLDGEQGERRAHNLLF